MFAKDLKEKCGKQIDLAFFTDAIEQPLIHAMRSFYDGSQPLDCYNFFQTKTFLAGHVVEGCRNIEIVGENASHASIAYSAETIVKNLLKRADSSSKTFSIRETDEFKKHRSLIKFREIFSKGDEAAALSIKNLCRNEDWENRMTCLRLSYHFTNNFLFIKNFLFDSSKHVRILAAQTMSADVSGERLDAIRKLLSSGNEDRLKLALIVMTETQPSKEEFELADDLLDRYINFWDEGDQKEGRNKALRVVAAYGQSDSLRVLRREIESKLKDEYALAITFEKFFNIINSYPTEKKIPLENEALTLIQDYLRLNPENCAIYSPTWNRLNEEQKNKLALQLTLESNFKILKFALDHISNWPRQSRREFFQKALLSENEFLFNATIDSILKIGGIEGELVLKGFDRKLIPEKRRDQYRDMLIQLRQRH
jgi:hypothetical protein